MARILLVDDEANIRRILAMLLAHDGHEVLEAAGIREALAVVASGFLDLVITDQKMPDGEGIDLVAACRQADPTLPVVVLTAFASVELAVEAMRRGAFDFITKPFMPDVVRAAVQRACERADLLRENERLKVEVRRRGPHGAILGESPSIRSVRELVRRVAPTGSTVLIQGETGTGKELVARAIHDLSPRAREPFVAVNCAAVAETLLESELFGHERGAFTGADRARQGLFETAHRGTLLLDEAGEMSPALQAKLLRVLTDGRVSRVGSSAPKTVDVRILVATHRDLRKKVAEGKFREDLYFRIAVVPVFIPPLRERMDDLPVLSDHFVAQLAVELNTPPRAIGREAVEKLRGYAFPGNVRELRNLIERAYILARGGGPFGPEDFFLESLGVPDTTASATAGPTGSMERWLDSLSGRVDLRATLEAVERGLLVRALNSARGVQAEAARLVGISRSDMAYKLRKHGLVEEI
jgi:DNA-binding NtrC family response regulator